MLKKSPIPVVVQTTIVNLLREHYPMLTAEMLFTALDQYGNPRETVVRKKLTRSECAQHQPLHQKRPFESGQHQSATGSD